MPLAGNSTDLHMPPVAELLGRSEMAHDITAFSRFVRGKRVMVTGAGGSLGSQLCRLLLPLAPAALHLLERDESALEAVLLSMDRAESATEVELLLADIRDTDRISALFGTYQPEIVFHAAALKHVPLLQRHPEEALLTNVLGTLNVLSAAEAVDSLAVVNLSTDKAADPVNALGFSKYLSERLIAWFASRPVATRFVSVRLGNVLSTRGSMWDVFRAQITRGLPLTVTDDRATRYFTTPGEAVHLMFSACIVGRSGETLVQDLGDPVRMRDVVDQITAHFGGGFQVEHIGLRPGEKLHEILIGADEQVRRKPTGTPLSAVWVPPIDPAIVQKTYREMAGRVTTASLGELAALGRESLTGNGDGSDAVDDDPMRDQFGYPLKWALNFRRSGYAVERAAKAWGEREWAALAAATMLLDNRFDDALAVLENQDVTSFRDIFNAGIAHEQLGDQERASALLARARALDPVRFNTLRSKKPLHHATFVLPFPIDTGGGMMLQAEIARTMAEFGLDVSVIQMRDPSAPGGATPRMLANVTHVAGHEALTAELARRPRSVTIVGSWLDYLPALAAGNGPVIGYSGGEPTLNETEGFDERFLAQRYQTHQLPVRLMTCSRFVQDIYRDTFHRSSDYVPAAIDSRAFRPAHPAVGGPFRVLLMAWDGIRDKGLRYAVPALRSLQDRGLDIEIVWLSPRPPLIFTDLRCELHVDPPKDLLFEILRSCHALVYPPLVDGLGFPPLEAMAAGVPVVVTESGGSAEYAEHDTNCLIVEKSDSRAIATAVERLYLDPSLRERLIAEGHQSARRFRPANANVELHRFLHRDVPAVCTDLP